MIAPTVCYVSDSVVGIVVSGFPGLSEVEGSRTPSGNNSVVECDLAKVEVAGSNPVSRSIHYSRGPLAPLGTLRFRLFFFGRRRQVVRQRSAKPPPPVQIRAAPPNSFRDS